MVKMAAGTQWLLRADMAGGGGGGAGTQWMLALRICDLSTQVGGVPRNPADLGYLRSQIFKATCDLKNPRSAGSLGTPPTWGT